MRTRRRQALQTAGATVDTPLRRFHPALFLAVDNVNFTGGIPHTEQFVAEEAVLDDAAAGTVISPLSACWRPKPALLHLIAQSIGADDDAAINGGYHADDDGIFLVPAFDFDRVCGYDLAKMPECMQDR